MSDDNFWWFKIHVCLFNLNWILVVFVACIVFALSKCCIWYLRSSIYACRLDDRQSVMPSLLISTCHCTNWPRVQHNCFAFGEKQHLEHVAYSPPLYIKWYHIRPKKQQQMLTQKSLMSFDIWCHLTFHVIWHFMSFDISCDLSDLSDHSNHTHQSHCDINAPSCYWGHVCCQKMGV